MFNARHPPIDLVRALGSDAEVYEPDWNSVGEDVSLASTDRYSTPEWLCELIRLALGGTIDCDPFADPTSPVQAHHYIDARRGGNGYRDQWPGYRALVNAGYGGKLPQLTAARCREQWLRGFELVNVCPAAVGSKYWERDVWPCASAVAFLGRVAFPAGVDVYNRKGEFVCAAGVAQSGTGPRSQPSTRARTCCDFSGSSNTAVP